MENRPKDLWEFISNPMIREELKEYMEAETPEEKKLVAQKQRERTASLSTEEKENYQQLWTESMNEALDGSRQELEEFKARRLKEKLGKTPKAVSLSYIAKTYFGKSKEWLYQRINGNTVNGKSAHFTNEETKKLENALHDLGMQLIQIRLI